MPSFLLDMLRSHRRFAYGVAVLIVILLGTWVTRAYVVRTLQVDVEKQQQVKAENVLQSIQSQFNSLRDAVWAQAGGVATESRVQSALSLWTADTTSAVSSDRPPDLVRYFAGLRNDAHTSVEVYDASGRLLAWKGPRLPVDSSHAAVMDPAQEAMFVVRDGDVRTALVARRAVRTEGEVVGVVRIVRVLRYQPPVQNRFIRGFDLESEWTHRTNKPIVVEWGTPETNRGGLHTVLTSPRGDPLAVVSVDLLPAAELVRMTAQTYDDLMALWVTLLLFWIAGGAWVGVRVLGLRVQAAPPTRRFWIGVLAYLAATGFWWVVRYAMLALDVPSRWVDGTLLEPLFDPTHLASTLGAGLMRSTGDLLITSLFAAVSAAGLLYLGAQFRIPVTSINEIPDRIRETKPGHPSAVLFLVTLFALIASQYANIFIMADFVRRAVLDSTLDFFSRTGLLPEPLVLVVLCALFLLVVATVMGGIGVLWIGGRLLIRFQPSAWARGMVTMGITLVFLISVVILYGGLNADRLVPVLVLMMYLGTVGTTAFFGLTWPHAGVGQLTLRGLLPSILALTLLLYPMLYTGMDTQRREHMQEAAESFEAGRDPRVLFSIDQILDAARDELPPHIRAVGAQPSLVDSIAARIVRRSLLASLTTYEGSLTLFEDDGTPLYRYTAAGPQTRRTEPATADRNAFEVLRRTYRLRGGDRPVVEQLRADDLTGRRTDVSFQYVGLTPLVEPPSTPATVSKSTNADDQAAPRYWVLMRAEPRSLLPGTGTGIPRVLLPDGSFSDLYAELSLAEFRKQTLVRSLGRDFGRAQLPPTLQDDLARPGTQVWTRETIRGRQYLTYYQSRSVESQRPSAQTPPVIAVRIASVLAFDHLYYILRLAVAGFCVGLVIYILGVYGRFARDLLPAPQVRFRDKVLNAFLIVGVVSMVAVGIVGVQVVTSENDRVTERRLHDDLSRVEETLALQARPGERIWQAARRIQADSLAARVGLDVHIYTDGALVGTSRPRLVRDRLVDERLPVQIYDALYNDAFRFATGSASIGKFNYIVGYQALPDAQGRPRVVVAVPTLGQQERIVEEQARTLAYLFGALLLLVVVVMLTALILANALAQPIAQLREGLEAVGEGRFARELNVDTRDEIGDLVQTFNDMRDQLAESRRKLAQQERELAWREMARQVAHEIKNPLTPMKLSIQHMRRALKREQETSGPISDRFTDLFDRITGTLIEQINALVRIANEFSTFARLPTRVLEPLDLNEVIREAARLMREESDTVTINLDLHDDPLVVEADREELRRLYINLIKNAIQAIPSHRDGRIEVATMVAPIEGDASPAARTTISDNGTGIPEDLREKIFQPNFSTKTSGTGLGLAIARKGIEELDGQIGFETVDGEGTTFWIRLPLAEEATVEAS